LGQNALDERRCDEEKRRGSNPKNVAGGTETKKRERD